MTQKKITTRNNQKIANYSPGRITALQKNMKKTISYTLLTAIILFIGVKIISMGYEAYMIPRCYALQSQAVEYADKGFTVSDLDRKECGEVYGITISTK